MRHRVARRICFAAVMLLTTGAVLAVLALVGNRDASPAPGSDRPLTTMQQTGMVPAGNLILVTGGLAATA